MKVALLIAQLLVAAAAGPSEERLTVDQILAQARAANAQLPVAEQDVAIATEQLRQASGELLPHLALDGDAQVATGGSTYGGTGGFPGEDRLQVVIRQPIYQGGELRALRNQAHATLRAAKAGYRVAEKDLVQRARVLIARFLEAEEELGFRHQGIKRLGSYLLSVRSLRAAGRGSEADVLRVESQLADEEANIAEIQAQLDDARVQLNELMGRHPDAPLAIDSPPEPMSPPATIPSDWEALPDLEQVLAQQEAADAGIDVAHAGRLPHFSVLLGAGLFGPGFSGGTAADFAHRLSSDLGVTLTLTFSWPLLDFGIYRGRLGAANATALQAELRLAEERRTARLEAARARAQLIDLYRAIEARRRAVPLARDAYVSAESLYRGGAGTGLAVIDAYVALMSASRQYALSVLNYRVAEAQAIRWGTP